MQFFNNSTMRFGFAARNRTYLRAVTPVQLHCELVFKIRCGLEYNASKTLRLAPFSAIGKLLSQIPLLTRVPFPF